jgi:hypothetical protein
VLKGILALVIHSILVKIVNLQVVLERIPLILVFVQGKVRVIVSIIVHVLLITPGMNVKILFALERIFQTQMFVMVMGIALLLTIALVSKDTQVQNVS